MKDTTNKQARKMLKRVNRCIGRLASVRTDQLNTSIIQRFSEIKDRLEHLANRVIVTYLDPQGGRGLPPDFDPMITGTSPGREEKGHTKPLVVRKAKYPELGRYDSPKRAMIANASKAMEAALAGGE